MKAIWRLIDTLLIGIGLITYYGIGLIALTIAIAFALAAVKGASNNGALLGLATGFLIVAVAILHYVWKRI
jgi:hypothetical protein